MKMEPTGISSEMSFEMNNTTMTDAANCLWLVYDINEVYIKNDSLVISNTGKLYTSDAFEVLNESVIVCESDLGAKGIDITQFALGIITMVCVGISIICLVIRIVLQLCVNRFNSRPGKLQFNLAIAVLIAFVFLLAGPFMADNERLCFAAAVSLCYGIFASFCWMNVIAVDTWIAFRPSGAFTRSGDGERSLIKHMIVGWGIPLILVAISAGLDQSDIVENYRPSFGGKRCWFTHRIALLTYFALPIAISIILNIFFYVYTSINLHKAFADERIKRTKKSYKFMVYVRLFVLMGATWIFGFLSAFLDEPSIDFIFVILTSLQGLFMFISFVCNKQVFLELRKKFQSKEQAAMSDKCKAKPTKETSLNTSESKPIGSEEKNAQKEKSPENLEKRNVLMPPGNTISRSHLRKVVVSQIRKKFKTEAFYGSQVSADQKKRESIA